MNREKYNKELRKIIEKDFEPIRLKLINLTEEFKKENPNANENDLYNDRGLDTLAITTARIKDYIKRH